MTEGNSVKQGVGIGIGLILLFTTLGLLPFLCCGGLFVVGFMAAPMSEAARKVEQRRQEQEAELAKPIRLDK